MKENKALKHLDMTIQETKTFDIHMRDYTIAEAELKYQ